MAFTKINAAGIGSTETVTLDGLTVINDGSFGGNVSVGGTLTYEDVTNIDSVGLITARNGIVVGSGITLSKDGDIFATGITTVSGNVKVGTGITLSPDGNGFFTGVITATSYSGIDLSNVTGAQGDFSIVDKIVHTGDTDTAIRFSGADTVSVEVAGNEKIRIDDTYGLRILSQIYMTDSVPLYLGNANDFTLVHDGTDSRIRFNHTVGDLKFQNNSNSNLMVLDASGRLLLGTTTEGNANADDLTVANSGEGGITIRTGASSNGNIFFSDATSGAGEYAGYIDYKHSSNAMTFGTSGSERLRIDSKGQLSSGGSTTAFGGTSSLNGLQMYYETDSGLASFGSYSSGGGTNLAFYTNSGGSAATEKLRIDSNGYVSIGTNNDALAQLSLVYSTVPAYLTNSFDGTVGEATLSVNVPRTSAGSGSWGSHNNTGYGSAAIQALSHSSSGGYVSILTGSADNTNPTEKVRIDNYGFCRQPYKYHLIVERSGNLSGVDVAGNFGTAFVYNNIALEQKDSGLSSAFNTSNGLFTVPVDGIYFCEASVYAPGVSLSQGWFVVNGSRQTYTDWVQATTSSIVNVNAMIKLTAGNTVGFHPHGGGGQSSVQINATPNHTWMRITFMG